MGWNPDIPLATHKGFVAIADGTRADIPQDVLWYGFASGLWSATGTAIAQELSAFEEFDVPTEMVPPFMAAVEAWLDQLPDDLVLQAEWSGPTVIASRNDVVTAIRGVLRKCDQAKAAGDPLMLAL